MADVQPVPQGYHSVTPYLVVDGASRAIEFYKRAFGAVERFRMPAPDDKVGHAEIQIGDSVIMLSDPFPGMGSSAPFGTQESAGLMLYVPDVDAVFKQAVDAGATVTMPLDNQFWGDRYGKVRDPFGHSWHLATHVEDVSPEEMMKRAEAAFASAPQA
ncbi:MAG TPA: VOC family protein [Vicinamibacterales bacterium]|jgi:PhnB protein|nr:VOC family protein [Vicinamibacterales bacterium]